ncbi:hypothetical protein GJ744_008851 [Endocarpon pusillum]|uniref:Response regulatory domain-containing protein n=1 Tax=Endocarpon pusillum TaxID=364733 RepID=A0A8H7ASK8_9EURO|nr:hypothetical protein GJ744_008851 [Endocarpon pusillum]
MAIRKLWVRRGNASATQVAVSPDDLVDDVRDAVIRKYLNSIGRTFDAPDVSLRICPREQTNKAGNERTLAPDEPIVRLIDAYYPGGQKVEEALIIDVPQRRTPKPSPRSGPHLQSYYIAEEIRPGDADDYFPPMPALQSPHANAHGTLPTSHSANSHLHSMAVLTTGQLPPLPSPGGRSNRHRPKAGRQTTSSPTILHSAQISNNHLDHKQPLNGTIPPPTPPLPTPPAQNSDSRNSTTPPTRVASPPPNPRQRSGRRKGPTNSMDRNGATRHHSNMGHVLPTAPASVGLLDTSVPPINVLIVEDNVINLKLLEAFMKRLKVRWKTAMNGKEAVAVWRTGGFHLVLMDIQLPVMNGLEATKEIRRLEALNKIGVLSGSLPDGLLESCLNGDGVDGDLADEEMKSEDRLQDRKAMFKSPVIIVALTASSLQSDRHEALAAGCNDFLTKPVNFVWMERKVTEWGCMQALIDFDGWRKWKGLAAQEEANKTSKKGESKADQRAALKAIFSQPPKTRKEREKEKERELKERENAQVGGPVGGPVGASTGGRPKSPTNVRRPTGKTNIIEVNGNGYDGKNDSSTSGTAVMPEKR